MKLKAWNGKRVEPDVLDVWAKQVFDYLMKHHDENWHFVMSGDSIVLGTVLGGEIEIFDCAIRRQWSAGVTTKRVHDDS